MGLKAHFDVYRWSRRYAWNSKIDECSMLVSIIG